MAILLHLGWYKGMRLIYITGCSHSGSTMLLGLMNAFNFPVHPSEMSLAHVYTHMHLVRDRYDGWVAKRNNPGIFSNTTNRDRLEWEAAFIQKAGIEVLHISRSRDSMLAAKTNPISIERIEAVDAHIAEFGHLISLHVTYEEILLDPTGMQHTIADHFGLDMIHNWDDYPDFVPEITHLYTYWTPRRLGGKP